MVYTLEGYMYVRFNFFKTGGYVLMWPDMFYLKILCARINFLTYEIL